MSDLQWLWSYFNILEDEKEDELKWKSRLDYLGWWINPQLAKSVIESEKQKNSTSQNNQSSSFGNDPNPVFNENGKEIFQGETSVNNSFEEELRRALADSGTEEEDFTELPESDSVGNPFESQDDFISRVMANQNFMTVSAETNNQPLEKTLEEMGLDIDDIDFFESPE